MARRKVGVVDSRNRVGQKVMQSALRTLLAAVLSIGLIPACAFAQVIPTTSINDSAYDALLADDADASSALADELTEEQSEVLGEAFQQLTLTALEDARQSAPSSEDEVNESSSEDASLASLSIDAYGGQRVSQVGTMQRADYRSGVSATEPLLRGLFSWCGLSTTRDFDATYYYSDAYFLSNPADYDTHLATMSFALTLTAGVSNKPGGYEKQYQNAYQLLGDTGYSAIHVTDTFEWAGSYGTIAGIMANKTISLEDGQEYVVVPVALRGLGYGLEWCGNVTTGATGEHANFSDAADYMMSNLESYLADQGLTEAARAGKVKFWITGFSRSAAVANLLSKRLVDAYQGYGCDVYGYTVAAPQAGVGDASAYPTIHNTLNSCDLIPAAIPTCWGLIRYGVDKTLVPSELGYDAIRGQIAIIDDSITYNPETFALYKVNKPSLSLAWSIARHPSQAIDLMVTQSSAVTDQAKDEQAVVGQLVTWCGLDREGYVSERTIDSVVYPSLQTAFQRIMPLRMSLTSDEWTELERRVEDIGLVSNAYSFYKIYRYGLYGYNNLPKTTGKGLLKSTITRTDVLDAVWGLIGSESESGTVANFLFEKVKDQDFTWSDFKNDFYTILDVLFLFMSNDSQTPASDIAALEAMSSDMSVLTGTLMETGKLMATQHYPQVQLAMLRLSDSFYGSELPVEAGVTWSGWDASWNTEEMVLDYSADRLVPTEVVVKVGGEEQQLQTGRTNKLKGSGVVELRNQNPGNIMSYTLTKTSNGVTTTLAENESYESAITLDPQDSHKATYTLTVYGWEFGHATETTTYKMIVPASASTCSLENAWVSFRDGLRGGGVLRSLVADLPASQLKLFLKK